MRQVGSLDLTKSSVCSLISTTTTITVSNNRQKKNVLRNLVIMYLSIFFMQDGKVIEISLYLKAEPDKILTKFGCVLWVASNHSQSIRTGSNTLCSYPCGCPCILKIEAPGYPIDIHDLSCKKQVGHDFTLHSARVYF